MRIQHVWETSILLFALVVLAGCTDKKEEGRDRSSENGIQDPVVYVSNYPLRFFIERLAPWAEVRFPADVSGDPAYWKPIPDDVAAMQEADLIVLNGAGYETWFKNVSLSPSKLVNSAAGFSDRLIPLEDRTTHSHGLEGEHEHSGTAFTIWLDMKLAQEQVHAIAEALSARWPEHDTQVRQSSDALVRELQVLDDQMEKIVSAAPDRPVIFSHPVYQYLQERYGINGISVHWEPGELPDTIMWEELTSLASSHLAKWMIWEGAPLQEVTTQLQSIGIRSVVFDPCAGSPSQGDFLDIMNNNVEALRTVFGDQ